MKWNGGEMNKSWQKHSDEDAKYSTCWFSFGPESTVPDSCNWAKYADVFAQSESAGTTVSNTTLPVQKQKNPQKNKIFEKVNQREAFEIPRQQQGHQNTTGKKKKV